MASLLEEPSGSCAPTVPKAKKHTMEKKAKKSSRAPFESASRKRSTSPQRKQKYKK